MSHDIHNMMCPLRNNPYATCTCAEQRQYEHVCALNRHSDALREADNGKDSEIESLRSQLAAMEKERDDAREKLKLYDARGGCWEKSWAGHPIGHSGLWQAVCCECLERYRKAGADLAAMEKRAVEAETLLAARRLARRRGRSLGQERGGDS